MYDMAFKRLMENEKAARFFIGTLLDETVESVDVKPHEINYVNDLGLLALFRMDFVANIKTSTGEHKKILVEVQKAKNLVDVMRFRNYLGEQYKKEDIINGKKMALPITTIYVLGFNLPEIATPCLKIERNYKDLVNQKIITAKSEFAESLTHTCFIVQAQRITDKFQTRLEKLLSIFEQANFIGSDGITKEFNHDTDVEELKIITDILHYAGTDPTEKKKMEMEQEAWRSIEAMYTEREAKLLSDLREKDQALDEKNKLIEELQRRLNQNNP